MDKHDLNQMWEEHCKHEFTTRDVNATLDTMVEDADVNHVPTLTGGVLAFQHVARAVFRQKIS